MKKFLRLTIERNAIRLDNPEGFYPGETEVLVQALRGAQQTHHQLFDVYAPEEQCEKKSS